MLQGDGPLIHDEAWSYSNDDLLSIRTEYAPLRHYRSNEHERAPADFGGQSAGK